MLLLKLKLSGYRPCYLVISGITTFLLLLVLTGQNFWNSAQINKHVIWGSLNKTFSENGTSQIMNWVRFSESNQIIAFLFFYLTPHTVVSYRYTYTGNKILLQYLVLRTYILGWEVKWLFCDIRVIRSIISPLFIHQ